jgi:hypothetical protein
MVNPLHLSWLTRSLQLCVGPRVGSMSKRLIWRKDGQSEPAATSRMDGTWIGNTFLLGSSSLAVAAATPLGSIIVGVGTTVVTSLGWLPRCTKIGSGPVSGSFLQPNGTRTGSSRAGYGTILEPPPSYGIAGNWNPISRSCENQNWIKISKVIWELELNWDFFFIRL